MPPKFYRFPKIHKSVHSPQAYRVQLHGSVTHGVAKVLTKILKATGRQLPIPNLHGTQDFVEQANKVTFMLGECLSSYDVTALFTSVPKDPALGIIKDLPEKDNTLKERTVLLVKDIILLLEFALKTPTFLSRINFMKR